MSSADRIAALAPEQREVLMRLLREQAGQTTTFTLEQPKISAEPVDRFAPVPLTDVQQAYWLGVSGVFDLGGSGVNIYLEYDLADSAWTFASRLNVPLRRVIERHEILRTVVLPAGRQQVLREVPPFEVQVKDLSGRREEWVEKQLEAARERMRYARSRSDRWPLFDILVHQLPEGRIRVHARFDGVMMDGIGREKLLEEISFLIREPEGELPPLQVSFLDHARALHAFRKTTTYERSRQYWMEQIASLPPWPRLPLARDLGPDTVPRIVKRTPDLLPAEAWTALKRRAARVSLTPTGIVTAAFAEVLRPWSDNPDFTLGIEGSYHPPTHPQIRQAVGNFATIHLLAVEGTAGPFVERARQLQQRITANVEHEHFSGHAALRELNRRRRAGDHAVLPVLFDSILEFSHSSYRREEGEPLVQTPESAEATEAAPGSFRAMRQEMMISFPQVLMLCVVLENGDGSLSLVSQSVEELLPEGMIPTLIDGYAGLLARLAEDDAAWREESPASPRVPEALVAPAVATAAAVALPDLFLERARERPGDAALIAGPEVVTYGELDERSRGLADRLVAAGARPGSRVAVALEGPDTVAAALAAWRIGATWVPADPAAPAELTEELLVRSGAHFVVTRQGVEERAGTTPPAGGPGGFGAAPDPPACVWEEAAVDHAQAAAVVLDLARRFGWGPGDRVLASAPLSSDLCLLEIFGALASGATAVLPARGAAGNGGALAELAARERVTVWSSLPVALEEAVAQVELRSAGASPLRSLRLVLVHREPAPAGLAERLRAVAPGARAVAVWGTPEVPVAAAVGSLEKVAPGALLCTEPVAGRRLYVLDGSRSPRPAGVPGELCVGGPGECLVRTGVRARALVDGTFEVLAPVDDAPVDEAGYGADLRRVETALQGHPGLRHAVVRWRPGQAGERGSVVAWVVPRALPGPSDEEIRRYLLTCLPEHLLPAEMVRLESLPQTRDGRIDREALPQVPAPPAPAEDADWSPLETELAGIWEEVLGRRPARRADDFFALGGDSLRAVQLLDRVRQRWGPEISAANFFARPTVARLAEVVSRRPAPPERRLSLAERLRARAGALTQGLRRSRETRTRKASYGMRLFLLLWFSQFVSGVGTGLGSFALGVWVYRQNASTTQYSLMAFLATCTALLIGPLAGVLADRWDRRRLILLGDCGAAVMTSLMALALYTGQMRLWHVYIIVVFMVGFSALQGPAFTASVSLLVPRGQLGRASGMAQAAGIATGVVCPPLAGALVPVIDYYGVILIDISTFLFAFLVLLFIRLPRPPAATANRERSSMRRDFLFGWAYIRARPGLLTLLGLFAVTNFSVAIVQVLLTPLILSFGSATDLGAVQSAAAAGGLIGSVALSLWGGPRNRVACILLFVLLKAPILLLGALQPSVMLIALAAFLYMGLSPVTRGLSQAIWQSKVAHHVQGRVFAMSGLIATSMSPLAFLLAGPLADGVFKPLLLAGGPLADTAVGRLLGVGPGRGVGLMFICLGLMILLAVTFASLSPRLRQLETELPDAIPDSDAAASRPKGETRFQTA